MPQKKNLLSSAIFLLSVAWPWLAHSQTTFPGSSGSLNAKEQTQVQQLLETFGGHCSLTQGPASDAIALVNQLRLTIKGILDDENCAGIAGNLDILNSAYAQAQSLAPYIHGRLADDAQLVLENEAKKKALILALSQETDSSIISNLKTSLYEVESELATASANADTNLLRDHMLRRAEAANLLAMTAQSVTESVVNQKACINSKPEVLRDLVTLGSSIASTAAFAIGQVGPAMLLSTGGKALNSILGYFEDLAIRKKLKRFDLSLQPIALGCTLERITEVMCNGLDGIRAIESAKVFQKNDKDPFWQGVDILQSDLPNLLRWLDKVRVRGDEPAGPGDATVIIELGQKRKSLENSLVRFNGDKNKLAQTLSRYPNSRDQFKFLRDFAQLPVERFCQVSHSGGSQIGHPLCETVDSFDYQPYFLLGVTPAQYGRLLEKFGVSVYPISNFTFDLLAEIEAAPPTLSVVIQNFLIWHGEAKRNLEIQEELFLTDDLRVLFSTTLFGKNNGLGRSAADSLNIVLDFIKSIETQYLNQNPFPDTYLKLLKQIKESLESLRREIQAIEEGRDSDEELKCARDRIIQKLNLVNSSNFIRRRVFEVVRDFLRTIAESPNLLPDNVSIQALASEDFVNDLAKFSSGVGRQTLLDSFNISVGVMRESIEPFIDLFEGPLESSLKALKDDPYGKPLRTKICFYLLGSNSYRKFYKHCDGVQVETLYGLRSESFSKALFDKPLDRACIARNLYRKDLLIEKGILPRPGAPQPRQKITDSAVKSIILKSKLKSLEETLPASKETLEMDFRDLPEDPPLIPPPSTCSQD